MTGVPRHIDPELDKAIERLEDVGDFTTKRKASRKAGEIINKALNQFVQNIEEETRKTVNNQNQGFNYEMLGLNKKK